MAIEPRASATSARLPRTRSVSGGGTTGNERLTAAVRSVPIALLAVIGVTIVSPTRLLWVHLFVGMLPIGLLAAGLVIAILVIPQFAPWRSSQHFHH